TSRTKRGVESLQNDRKSEGSTAVGTGETDRRQRVLSDVSRVLLDYVGPDEIEPLRRIVQKVTEAFGDWCGFSLVQADGTLRSVAAFHPDPRQRELEQKLNKV